ncbi:MAG: hypothetical protein K2N74_05405, partial [Clostridiales bacterium]|nr:hypothetical protein [Clostridiales bacterium]
DKQRIYGVGKIELDGVGADIFCGYGIDAAEKIIDEAVRDRRERGADITLSREDIQSYYTDYKQPLMGFGGITYVHK